MRDGGWDERGGGGEIGEKKDNRKRQEAERAAA